MLLAIAWRNVIRSRRRSMVTGVLSFFTTALFIFYITLMDGSYAKMFKDSVEIYPGYIQITHKAYREEPSNEHLVEDTAQLIKTVAAHKEVAHVAARFESFALFASDENAIGGLFTAIDPLVEPHLSRITKTLKAGRYLTSDDTHEVIVGTGLAKRLKIKVGERFSMIGSGVDESFTADNFTAVGLFETGLADFDNNAVFINKRYFDDLMSAHDKATHIIIQPLKSEESQKLASLLSQLLAPYETLVVEDWRVYLKTLIEAMELDRASGMIFLWLFVILIFSVVMIYVYLAIYARTKEVGIMRAIGTTPGQIVSMILLETLLLASIAIILGSIAGGAMSYYFQIHPMEFKELEDAYRQYGILEAVLPTDFSWGAIAKGASYILFLNFLAVVYPLWQIVRIKPIDAMHHI